MSRGRRLTAPHPSSPCPRSSEKGGVCLLWQNPAAPCSSLLPSLPPAFALSSFGSAPASCTWKRSCCLVLLRTQKTSLSSAVLPHPRVGDRNSYLKRLQDGPGGQETVLQCLLSLHTFCLWPEDDEDEGSLPLLLLPEQSVSEGPLCPPNLGCSGTGAGWMPH
ncbi:uncharacterized protein LOC133625763 isoform X5 [Colius striatus]|uniref:uncharacterized protein LOC133625763 isoform X5 n=1 Tax=Colius striatus TaxID=57412 RepID=UPI002B1DEB4B|nr:uncharacterized protein LOC133625763 isoform X5 [Colius striatus]